MTRIMVTGTSGFIGRHLAALLVEQGHSVEGVDRRLPTHGADGWTHRTCDLLDARRLTETIAKFAPEIVLHLAARTDLDEERDLAGYAANVDGVRNLAVAVRAAGPCDELFVRRASWSTGSATLRSQTRIFNPRRYTEPARSRRRGSGVPRMAAREAANAWSVERAARAYLDLYHELSRNSASPK